MERRRKKDRQHGRSWIRRPLFILFAGQQTSLFVYIKDNPFIGENENKSGHLSMSPPGYMMIQSEGTDGNDKGGASKAFLLK